MNLKSWFKFDLNKLDSAAYLLVGVVLITGLLIALRNPENYEGSFVVEDGAVEYGTALMLLGSSILCAVRFVRLAKSGQVIKLLVTGLLVILFLFGAGEEVSWGQRIFNVESSEFFKENNAQGETNLHNLVVGETKINKIIFGQLLTAVLVVYLFVMPLLYLKSDPIRGLIDRFGVPLPKAHHGLAFLISTLIVLAIPSGKKWEVYEFAFAFIFFIILYYPFNRHTFSRG